MLEVVFVPHRQVVGLLLCISVGWAPSPFELAFGDEFYPSPFIMVSKLFFLLLFQRVQDRDFREFRWIAICRFAEGSRFADLQMDRDLLSQRVRDLQMDRDFNGL